jgi:Tfp pilus assembly protein PilF
MKLREASVAAVFASAIFLQAGCVTSGGFDPPATTLVETRASKPKELPADQTAELCQAAAEELEKQGLNADAAAQYEKARERDPRRGPVVARRLAVLYDRLGDDANAFTEYKKALAAAPKDADLLNDFGYYFYQRGDLVKAEKYFRRATAANPNHLRATINLALALGKQGQIQASLTTFQQVLPPAQAHCNVGVLEAQQGDTDAARKSLREALRLDPGLKQARAVLDHLNGAADPAGNSPPS